MRTMTLLLALLLAVSTLAATAPEFVANNPGTGFLPVYDSSVTDRYLNIIQVTATTADCSMSFWSYSGAAWAKEAPEYWEGATTADSVITVPAGATMTFVFPPGDPDRPAISAIFVSAGDAIFMGEGMD